MTAREIVYIRFLSSLILGSNIKFKQSFYITKNLIHQAYIGLYIFLIKNYIFTEHVNL